MNKTKHIAIIGAGVAGLATAIFARQKGIQVSIYERQKEISTIGAGITLWPNATFIIKQLGLLDAIKKVSGRPKYIRQFDQCSVMQGELDINEINVHCGLPSLSILRRDLMASLAEHAVKMGAEIHFNQNVTQGEITNLTQRYDLVVGCDGRMHSAARNQLFKKDISPIYQGFINIIGISDLPENFLDEAIEDYRGQQQRFGIVPLNAKQCYWAAAWPAQIDKKRPESDWYEEMYQRFQPWPDKVQQVLSSHETSSLNRIFVHDLDPLPYWHHNNLLIIGDAAHAPLPTSGQGACQALEDAWHLIHCLDDQQPLNDQLDKFYQLRIDKTSTAQAVGRAVAKQIFSSTQQPSVNFNNTTAEEISELWMKGLE